MTMTCEEFNAMMAKNPQLRVRDLNTHKKKKTPAKVAFAFSFEVLER